MCGQNYEKNGQKTRVARRRTRVIVRDAAGKTEYRAADAGAAQVLAGLVNLAMAVRGHKRAA